MLHVQVDELYDSIIRPFCAEGHIPKWQDKLEEERRALYLWAMALVSAYSFSLGEDKFQAMVSPSLPSPYLSSLHRHKGAHLLSSAGSVAEDCNSFACQHASSPSVLALSAD